MPPLFSLPVCPLTADLWVASGSYGALTGPF